MTAKMAEQIGKQDIADKYMNISRKAADAFNRRFLKGDRYSASRFSDEELAEKIQSWLECTSGRSETSGNEKICYPVFFQ